MVSSTAQNKQQLIEAIRSRNHTADQDFLLTFNEQALQSYLDRLRFIDGHRGRDSVWVRPGDTSAIVTRRVA